MCILLIAADQKLFRTFYQAKEDPLNQLLNTASLYPITDSAEKALWPGLKGLLNHQEFDGVELSELALFNQVMNVARLLSIIQYVANSQFGHKWFMRSTGRAQQFRETANLAFLQRYIPMLLWRIFIAFGLQHFQGID